jgi:splicing factor 3B subunit 3
MMQLYNYTLQSPQSTTHAIFGHFSTPKAQELLVARGKVLELLRPLDDGRVVSVLKTEVFGVIRDLKPFRLPGSTRDFIVVGSDSGKMIILEYVAATNSFERVHEEPFGKTGCRRIVPGQLLATDPKGRAVMVGALEKQKLIYTLARSAENKLTISSPLEAHRAQTVVFSMCGVHVTGYDNPVFACIEASYDENEDAPEDPATGAVVTSKHLVFYELDHGINTVTRVWSTPVDPGANMVLSVPGDAKRPGGVIVCAEDLVSYYARDQTPLHVPLPRRFNCGDDRTVLITAATTCNILKKNVDVLFLLLQSEYGDLYKVEFVLQPSPQDPDVTLAVDLSVSYFDTLPAAAALCLTDTGFLFSASEFGASMLLKLVAFGGKDEEGAVTASASLQGSAMIAAAETRALAASAGAPAPTDLDDGREFFAPRPLFNLEFISEVDSMAPVLGLKVADLTHEKSPQIYTICGRGNRSSLKALRYGLPVKERFNVELPGAPTGVFTARAQLSDRYHSVIALSFADSTIVLKGEDDMVEAEDTGLRTDTQTLLLTTFNEAGPAAAATAQGGWLQVHPTGVRLVTIATGRTSDWTAPSKRQIVLCAANESQLVVALDGGGLVYFEADHGLLREIETKALDNNPSSLALGPVPAGRQRSPFLAVGAYEKRVRVLSLAPGQVFRLLTVQELHDVPTSLALTAPGETTASDSAVAAAAATVAAAAAAAVGSHGALVLYIGLKSGVLVRSSLDPASGHLSDPSRRVLGTAPVHLSKVTMGTHAAVVALSTRAWAFYTYAGAAHEAPLSLAPGLDAIAEARAAGAPIPRAPVLDAVAPFTTAAFPQGLVCTSGASLRVLAPEALGALFGKQSAPLRYTPRRLAAYEPKQHRALATAKRAPAAAWLVTVEADDSALTFEVKEAMTAAMRETLDAGDADAAAADAAAAATAAGAAMGDDSNPESAAAAAAAATEAAAARKDAAFHALELQCGVPQAAPGRWGSCLRLTDPVDLSTAQVIEMADNECALSAAVCALGTGDDAGVFVVVGVVKDLVQTPKRRHSGGAILVYQLLPANAADGSGARLDFVHRTPVTDVPLALSCLRAERMLLAGVGNALRLYELGKRKMLLKSELKIASASTLTSVHVNDEAGGAPLGASAAAAAAELTTNPLAAAGTRVTVGDATTGFYTCLYTVTQAAAASAAAPLGAAAAAAPGVSLQRRFAVVATSPVPRVLSAAACVDPLTMAGGDRFGNVFFTRLSLEDADRIETDPTGGARVGKLGETVRRPPAQLSDSAVFHIGDMLTGIELASLTPGGQKAVVYTTMLGSIGVLAPIGFKEDVEFFTHLELHLRSEVPSLVGRDHLSFRSYYSPVSHVIDGDLCEVYAESYRGHQQRSLSGTGGAGANDDDDGAAGGVGLLTPGQLHSIAEELTCKPRDVVRKIDELKQRIL